MSMLQQYPGLMARAGQTPAQYAQPALGGPGTGQINPTYRPLAPGMFGMPGSGTGTAAGPSGPQQLLGGPQGGVGQAPGAGQTQPQPPAGGPNPANPAGGNLGQSGAARFQAIRARQPQLGGAPPAPSMGASQPPQSPPQMGGAMGAPPQGGLGQYPALASAAMQRPQMPGQGPPMMPGMSPPQSGTAPGMGGAAGQASPFQRR